MAPGCTLIVHSSLRAVGWVAGGASSVVTALIDAIGPTGTLAMPAATPLPTAVVVDPARAVPDDVALFDRATTPTTLGIIPESFRTWPGTLRSDHPLESVSARGPLAETIIQNHPLDFSEGEDGPFGRLFEADAQILLLGVGFNRCTALHYAESRSARRRTASFSFPAQVAGQRVWRTAVNVADDNDRHFPVIGRRYLATGRPARGTIGDAPSVLCSMRDLVRSAVGYFDETLSPSA